jgi:dipeptidyl-peptidase-4
VVKVKIPIFAPLFMNIHFNNTIFMGRHNILKIVICLLISTSVQFKPAIAQMHQRSGDKVAITGWTDETHYLIRTFDTNKNPVIQSVDIKTGKGVIVPPVKSGRELLAQSLPQGTKLTMNDEVSPDMKSAILLKDNDLYFFTVGDMELRRLTNDKADEINARFSPDGRKIAYTKNKDLYVYDLINNKEIRLTSDASEKVYNGYSSWVYMEEILGRSSHYAAFWWSPDGNKLAWLRTDETEVPCLH